MPSAQSGRAKKEKNVGKLWHDPEEQREVKLGNKLCSSFFPTEFQRSFTF